jgi:Domain of unknown function (DUF2017)
MLHRPIERTRDGGFRLRLSPEERELLRGLPAQLRSLLEREPDDPSLRRLFPPAYEDDAEGEAEYRRLLHGELLAGHRGALAVLERTAGQERLGRDELEAWLGALNDLRLVLGTRLDVSEEVYEQELDPLDPEASELALYAYLTWLQEHTVAAAATGLD